MCVCVGVCALTCTVHMWCSWLSLCVQDLQESEGCQDELALRVQQLKAELVLFKGLMSNVSPAFNSFKPLKLNHIMMYCY